MKDNYDRLAQEAAEFGCSILIREREDNSHKIKLVSTKAFEILFFFYIYKITDADIQKLWGQGKELNI